MQRSVKFAFQPSLIAFGTAVQINPHRFAESISARDTCHLDNAALIRSFDDSASARSLDVTV